MNKKHSCSWKGIISIGSLEWFDREEGILATGWCTDSGVSYSNGYIAKRIIETDIDKFDVTLSVVKGVDNLPTFRAEIRLL